MRTSILIVMLLVVTASSSMAIVVDGKPVRPVTTYSIVARDPDSGQPEDETLEKLGLAKLVKNYG